MIMIYIREEDREKGGKRDGEKDVMRGSVSEKRKTIMTYVRKRDREKEREQGGNKDVIIMRERVCMRKER